MFNPIVPLQIPLGTYFKHRGTRYEYSGTKPQNRKYPILAINLENGKSYKIGKGCIKNMLAWYNLQKQFPFITNLF